MVGDVAGGGVWSMMWQAGVLWSVMFADRACIVGDVAGGI